MIFANAFKREDSGSVLRQLKKYTEASHFIGNPLEAYKDPLYEAQPKNGYAGNGIIPQLVKEKTGKIIGLDL